MHYFYNLDSKKKYEEKDILENRSFVLILLLLLLHHALLCSGFGTILGLYECNFKTPHTEDMESLDKLEY